MKQTHRKHGFTALLSAVLSLLLSGAASPADSVEANAIVATDGSGQYRTVQDAINAAPQTTNATNRWTILVRPGTYKEVIYVQREKRFVRLLGEEAAKTTLTFDLNANLTGLDGKPIGTFRTPTVYVDADDFTIENLTLENSAGPVGQALALRVDGDRAVFRRCRFLGWQDTILVNRGRHYFEDCYVAGHVDFIFGGATVWFEKCHIHCLRNGYITAASTPQEHAFGFVFAHCKITGEPEVKTYLGRPWRPYAGTVFLNTEMSEVVRPEGWHNWDKPEREQTVRYAEFRSAGSGAKPGARVKWSRQLSDNEAEAMTILKVLGGPDGWNPTLDRAAGLKP